MKKKILAILLSALMIVGIMPMAVFAGAGFTVTFNTNGGSAIENQIIGDGLNIKYPAIPEKEGYIFDGWYADEDLKKPWDFLGGKVTVDTMLYAKWKAIDSTCAFISAKSITLDPGKSVDLAIQLKNNPGIAGLSFEVEYDSTVLTLTNVKFGTWEGQTNFNQTKTSNPVKIVLVSTTNITGACEVATLTFSVAGSATKDAKSQIKFHSVTATNDRLGSVPIYGKVQDVVYGDVDGNGGVDISDAVLLEQFLAQWTVTIDAAAADCDLSGTVDISDAVLLKQFLAGWEVTLGGETPPAPPTPPEEKVPDIEIEASDLLGTSSSSISFQVTQSLFDLSDEQGWSYDGNIAQWSKGTFPFHIKTLDGNKLENGKYYTITEGVQYIYHFDTEYDELGVLTFCSNLTEGNNGTEVSSLKSIVDWLQTHGSWYQP